LGVYEKLLQVYPEALGEPVDDTIKLTIRNQLLRLTGTVYRADEDWWYGYDSPANKERDVAGKRWNQFVAEVFRLHITWDRQRNRYTLPDGSTLPPIVVKRYRREIWNLDGVVGEGSLIIQRRGKLQIGFYLHWEGVTGTKIEPAVIRVYTIRNRSKPLVEINVAKAISSAGPGTLVPDGVNLPDGVSLRVRFPAEASLKEGEQIQVELVRGKAVRVSPVYTP
jgi:hypothetical protein